MMGTIASFQKQKNKTKQDIYSYCVNLDYDHDWGRRAEHTTATILTSFLLTTKHLTFFNLDFWNNNNVTNACEFPPEDPYAVSCNSWSRWLISAFIFSLTLKQAFEMIYIKLKFIWYALGGSHCSQYTAKVKSYSEWPQLWEKERIFFKRNSSTFWEMCVFIVLPR